MHSEAISVFDMFKICVGPSSSHTLGPWRAAERLVNFIRDRHRLENVVSVKVFLYGSLAKTGKGHGTDLAIVLGLSGANPELIPVEEIHSTYQHILQEYLLLLGGKIKIAFNPSSDIIFLTSEILPFHPNGINFQVELKDGNHVSQTYYSIGGGFVTMEGETSSDHTFQAVPFSIETAADLLHWCSVTNKKVHEIVFANELTWRDEDAIKEGVLHIWQAMKDCIYQGCHTIGELPGGLRVKRRASEINTSLLQQKDAHNIEEWMLMIQSGGNDFRYILDWVSCFALAVNEENASFGRVVTAPTNGAAGVIPAVLLYYVIFCDGDVEEKIIHFLLTASEIGSIFKKGATISAALGGCQAEIGVSSAMAAAALAEGLGGTPQQVLMAAEIAMEHHLGLTCDPIGGLVQIPCIERNTMGAIKAITAAQLSLQSKPDLAIVSLDKVIATMWHTALDMNHKYKETADGGLATQISIGLPEC